MKAIKIILVSVIGLISLVGFATNGFAQDAGDSVKPQANLGTTVNPEVKQLPEAARNALNAAGVTDVAGMIVIDKKGQLHMMKSAEVEHRENVTFPIPTTEIRGIVPMTIVQYEGSNCITYVLGGTSYTICW